MRGKKCYLIDNLIYLLKKDVFLYNFCCDLIFIFNVYNGEKWVEFWKKDELIGFRNKIIIYFYIK